MESLAKTIELQKKRMDIYEVEDERTTKELLQYIAERVKELEKSTRYTLSEQEKLYYKSLSIEEVTKEMMINQQEMKKNIDTLIERWG